MDYEYHEATLDLLRITIPIYGILVPIIVRSGTSEIIDGRHRVRIREELAEQGISITLPVHHVDTDNPAEVDAIVNSIRRPWNSPEERKKLVKMLKEKGHSNQVIAEAVNSTRFTVTRDLASGPTRANAPVGPAILVSSSGKDGKLRKPAAMPDEIVHAWSMKESGMSTPAIAKDLGRGEQTVRNWLKKPRPEPVATPEPTSPALERPLPAAKPMRPLVPKNLKQVNQKEQKWFRERWIPIAEHLAAAHSLIRKEHKRFQYEYAGAKGSLMMINRWEGLAKLWAESEELKDFVAATGNPEAVTLAGLFAELERSSRVSSQLIGSIETWTGCKPDLTRYRPPIPPDPIASAPETA
jgi:transposase